MKKNLTVIVIILFLFSAGCSTSYKAKPLSLQTPAAYPNTAEIAGCQIGAKAFADAKAAKEAFGFDVLGAGMLPVQVVFDNQGPHPLEIVGHQTFLEDNKGNLWPILNNKLAYERATKYAETKKMQAGKQPARPRILQTPGGASSGFEGGDPSGGRP